MREGDVLPDAVPPAILAGREVTLLDVADRLLDRGVVLAGEATISLAGVDLIFLGLNLALASVETLRPGGGRGPGSGDGAMGPDDAGPGGGRATVPALHTGPVPGAGPESPAIPSSAPSLLPSSPGSPVDPSPPPISPAPGPRPPAPGPQIDIDPERPEQGLAKLVLTLVEFLRQLLERQAIRRMDGGALSDAEVERMGLALLRLEEKLHQLAGELGLAPEELTINLGPLGNLL